MRQLTLLFGIFLVASPAAALADSIELGPRPAWLVSQMADGDLKAGRLVQPFGPTLPSAYAYWLVSTPEVGEHRNVRLFRDWLLAEAAGARDDE